MRVVYLCLQPRGSGDASDTHVDGLLGALRDRGHDVRLLELRGPAGSLPRRLVRSLWIQLRAWRRIRDADVVWLRMHPAGVLAAALARASSFVVEVNGVPADFYITHPGLERFDRLLEWALRVQLRSADHIFAVTPGLAHRVRETVASGRVVVLPNAVDPSRFHPDAARPPAVPETYVIFFGALAPWQGIDIVLEAVEDPAWPDDVALLVLGAGSEREHVEEAARSSGGRVRYLGAVRPDAVPAFVANALASLVVKRYHDPQAGQSPLKFYESLAAGVPVIATAMSGMTDVESLQDAVVAVEPAAAAVAQAVAVLAQDPGSGRRMGAQGRAAVLDGHTWAHRIATVESELGLGDSGTSAHP